MELLLRYRDTRNKAVHEGITPTSDDARNLINLTKRIADQIQSLTELFHAGILEKRDLQTGEQLRFKILFRGYLRSGSFGAYILGPNNVSAMSWDSDTLMIDTVDTRKPQWFSPGRKSLELDNSL
jgi:hypothetical protein